MVELSFGQVYLSFYIRKKRNFFLKVHLFLGLGKVGLGAEGWREENTDTVGHFVPVVPAHRR